MEGFNQLRSRRRRRRRIFKASLKQMHVICLRWCIANTIHARRNLGIENQKKICVQI